MVCPEVEELCARFKCLSAHQRINTMCGMLELCLPPEVRFIGTVLEDLAKKDYCSLRDYEIRSNSQAKLLQMEQGDPHFIRNVMALTLSLLHSTNRTCANILYGILHRHFKLFDPNIVDGETDTEQKANREKNLLVLSMVEHHPAFSFHQRQLISDFCSKIHHGQGLQNVGHNQEIPIEDVDSTGNIQDPGKVPLVQPEVSPNDVLPVHREKTAPHLMNGIVDKSLVTSMNCLPYPLPFPHYPQQVSAPPFPPMPHRENSPSGSDFSSPSHSPRPFKRGPHLVAAMREQKPECSSDEELAGNLEEQDNKVPSVKSTLNEPNGPQPPAGCGYLSDPTPHQLLMGRVPHSLLPQPTNAQPAHQHFTLPRKHVITMPTESGKYPGINYHSGQYYVAMPQGEGQGILPASCIANVSNSSMHLDAMMMRQNSFMRGSHLNNGHYVFSSASSGPNLPVPPPALPSQAVVGLKSVTTNALTAAPSISTPLDSGSLLGQQAPGEVIPSKGKALSISEGATLTPGPSSVVNSSPSPTCSQCSHMTSMSQAAYTYPPMGTQNVMSAGASNGPVSSNSAYFPPFIPQQLQNNSSLPLVMKHHPLSMGPHQYQNGVSPELVHPHYQFFPMYLPTPRKTCHNCGAQEHRGEECPENTIDFMMSSFRLNYDNKNSSE